MPLRIVTILGRLKQDLAAELSPNAIEQACKQEKYSWRKRMLDPVTTVYLFILQILHGNTACSHVVHFGHGTSPTPPTVPRGSGSPWRSSAASPRGSPSASGRRRRPNRPGTATGSGSPMGRASRCPTPPSCRRPSASPAASGGDAASRSPSSWRLFDLATGMLLRVEPAPLRSHEMSRCAVATSGPAPRRHRAR